MSTQHASSVCREKRRRAVALIMVLLVLTTLAIIGTPFVVSMLLHDRASRNFAGEVSARQAARAAANHAVARLEHTSRPVEFEREAEALEAERPSVSLKRSGGRRSLGTRVRSAVRRDPRDSGGRSRRSRRTTAPGARSEESMLPGAMRISEKGPSPREYDAPEELETTLPPSLKLPPGAPVDPQAFGDPGVVRFQNRRGITTSAAVADEQGKINLNTAPPTLVGNLFGVSQLARPLRPWGKARDKAVYLDDTSPFSGRAEFRRTKAQDAKYIGAVVVVHPESGVVEAIAYGDKAVDRDGHKLVNCHRGSFLSGESRDEFPVGSFVYDLRGWKIGHHRLWSRRHGGFHPASLTAFRSVEAIREIANWQIAALFVSRFRNEGLTEDLLSEIGLDARNLEDTGLDPLLLISEDEGVEPLSKKEYTRLKRQLRKKGVRWEFIRKLERRRGARVVRELASRLEEASLEEAKRIVEQMDQVLKKDQRRKTKMDRTYLKGAVRELALLYRTPGIETVLPEDLERHRDALTVSSWVPARWGEAQALLSDILPDLGDTGGGNLTTPRPTEFNAGTVVRLRRHGALDRPEFNVALRGSVGVGSGVSLAYPILSAYRAYGATIQALQRHPVNVNTASRKVLRAVFTGVRGGDKKQVVTPYEADRLAELVLAKRPLHGHEEFFELLDAAVRAQTIDDNDVDPLFINAVEPNNCRLRVSTTGLCYATGDVYTVESRGILRSPSGREVAQARFREITQVSPAGVLSTGLLTQRDFADGIYLRQAELAIGYPEYHHQFLLSFPGVRSHLVQSRPLLLERTARTVAGGDLGSLRLVPSETREGRFNMGEIYHFRDTYDGLELAHGEPFELPISLGGDASSATQGRNAALRGRARGVGQQRGAGLPQQADLVMVPGGVEFWFRMRTYPVARSRDGLYKLAEAGTDSNRNYLVLLCDAQRHRVVLRIRDSSLPDPLVVGKAQYLEIEAFRSLELDTWYHMRLIWDGVFGGGAQLYIDGIPAGTDNLSTELLGAIPATGMVAAINVRDASRLPREGTVRIDGELFEYQKSGNSLRVRTKPRSLWRPLPPPPQPITGRPGGGPVAPPQPAAPVIQSPLETFMRAPGNRRGSTPSAHIPGARVSLHGYSLEIRRKIVDPASGAERQVPEVDSQFMVWGPGGLSTAEPLLAFNFPPDVSGIVHYIDFSVLEDAGAGPGGGEGRPGGGQGGPGRGDPDPGGQNTNLVGSYIVPLFQLPRPPNCPPEFPPRPRFFTYTATLPTYGDRNAVHYFQSRGVCRVGNLTVLYRKQALPAEYVRAQNEDCAVEVAQTIGLLIVGPYPPQAANVAGAVGVQGGQQGQQTQLRNNARLNQLSVRASGAVQGRYPASGILEVRGSPTPWEQASGRPNLLGAPLFAHNPDNVVEWMRYISLHEDLFVGRLGQNSNFRGYPSTSIQNKKQLDIPAAQPLRLVMELSEGGAGYGDYVSITTSDPAVSEPGVRRVYKVMERVDGRFLISLVGVDSQGREMSMSPTLYRHAYFRSMNPRLVKFPSWGLPQAPVGSVTLFGDARVTIPGTKNTRSSRSTGRSNVGGQRYREEEDHTGVTVDEIQRLRNHSIPYNPTYGPRVRFVVVPLDGGTVRFQQNVGLSGAIPAQRAITPSSPQDVLVVSLSTERGSPTLFGQTLEDGILRIGDELFYFEDPRGAGGQGSGQGRRGGGQGTATLTRIPGVDPTGRQAGQPPNPAVTTSTGSPGERDLLDRMVFKALPGVTNIQGHFERVGFARIHGAGQVEDFFEVFFYARLGDFSRCLRGQFGTPVLEQTTTARIHNVSRLLRLTGRALLGTTPTSHGLGEPVELVPYLTASRVMGTLTKSGLPVQKPELFSPTGGYLLLDGGFLGQTKPWEIVAHLGPRDGILLAPRDEKGNGCLRARFGTPVQPVTPQMIAYEMPFRYHDRYEPEVESEALAYLQKSFRVPGAFWRSIEWRERPSFRGRNRLCEVIVVARFGGAPEWDAEVTNQKGGLCLFEDRSRQSRKAARFDINQSADEMEIRVYFRYGRGSYSRLAGGQFNDDWKETPVLDALTVEYERDGTVVRHEELPF